MKYLVGFLSLIFLFVSIAVLRIYPGNVYVYGFFSISSLLVLIVGLQRSYFGVLFLSFFLVMGFWFKTTLHFLTHKAFVEPVGNFNFSPASWDEVFMAAAVGMAGFALGVLTFRVYDRKMQTAGRQDVFVNVDIPRIFERHRWFIYLAGFLAILSIAALNVGLGIHQVGLNPKTILLWPSNAVLSFMVNIGLMLIFSNFIFWDLKKNKSVFPGMLLLMTAAFLLSVSALSRGMYVLQTVPFFMALLISKKVNAVRLAGLAAIFIAFFLLSISLTQILRNSLYPNAAQISVSGQEYLTRLEVLDGGIENVKRLIQKGEKQEKHLAELEAERKRIGEQISEYKINKTNTNYLVTTPNTNTSGDRTNITKKDLGFQIKYGAIKTILDLAANRFVGIEGLMAMQSFADKSWGLLGQALVEKRSLEKPTFYQEVAQSTYRYTDMTEWQFATLPGAVAFFYYAGSFVAVFFGMFAFGLLLVFIEKGIYFLSYGNPFLLALVMSGFANAIAQFGITPRQDIPYYAMIFVTLAACWVAVRFLNAPKAGKT